MTAHLWAVWTAVPTDRWWVGKMVVWMVASTGYGRVVRRAV